MCRGFAETTTDIVDCRNNRSKQWKLPPCI